MTGLDQCSTNENYSLHAIPPCCTRQNNQGATPESALNKKGKGERIEEKPKLPTCICHPVHNDIKVELSVQNDIISRNSTAENVCKHERLLDKAFGVRNCSTPPRKVRNVAKLSGCDRMRCLQRHETSRKTPDRNGNDFQPPVDALQVRNDYKLVAPHLIKSAMPLNYTQAACTSLCCL